jgi:hypothetical protein
VRVLPEPVGARISVWSPSAMAGQPLAWAAVGAGKLVSNQARTGSEKRSSAMLRAYEGGRTSDPGYATCSLPSMLAWMSHT